MHAMYIIELCLYNELDLTLAFHKKYEREIVFSILGRHNL